MNAINFGAFKGWRTIAFNVLVAVGAALGAMTDQTDMKTALSIILFAAINGFLRSKTDTPIGKGGGA